MISKMLFKKTQFVNWPREQRRLPDRENARIFTVAMHRKWFICSKQIDQQTKSKNHRWFGIVTWNRSINYSRHHLTCKWSEACSVCCVQTSAGPRGHESNRFERKGRSTNKKEHYIHMHSCINTCGTNSINTVLNNTNGIRNDRMIDDVRDRKSRIELTQKMNDITEHSVHLVTNILIGWRNRIVERIEHQQRTLTIPVRFIRSERRSRTSFCSITLASRKQCRSTWDRWKERVIFKTGMELRVIRRERYS